jgi:hypothetical protein
VSAWSWTSAPFNTVNTPSQIKEEKKKEKNIKNLIERYQKIQIDHFGQSED